MISYDVDEQNKIITCTIQGEELKNCAIKHIQKLLHSTPNNIFQINTDKLYLSILEKQLHVKKHFKSLTPI